jgi:hypothetical protein
VNGGHLEHVKYNGTHDDNVESGRRHQLMERLSPESSGDVCTFVFRLRLKDHLLNVDPAQVLFCIALLFPSLSFREFHEQNTKEEVQEEETSDQDENDEESHVTDVVLQCGAVLDTSCVESLEHDVWPAFQT